jgi:hypothetical protein
VEGLADIARLAVGRQGAYTGGTPIGGKVGPRRLWRKDLPNQRNGGQTIYRYIAPTTTLIT